MNLFNFLQNNEFVGIALHYLHEWLKIRMVVGKLEGTTCILAIVKEPSEGLGDQYNISKKDVPLSETKTVS